MKANRISLPAEIVQLKIDEGDKATSPPNPSGRDSLPRLPRLTRISGCDTALRNDVADGEAVVHVGSFLSG